MSDGDALFAERDPTAFCESDFSAFDNLADYRSNVDALARAIVNLAKAATPNGSSRPANAAMPSGRSARPSGFGVGKTWSAPSCRPTGMPL
jgi:hypothetical protein